MPWPLGTGELVARLKRGLGIRGALPLELDESIVPMVQVASLTEAPFRVDPVRFDDFDVVGAVAAQNGFAAIYLNTDDQVLALIERVDAAYDAAAAALTGFGCAIARTSDLPAGTEGFVTLVEPVAYDGTQPQRTLPRTRTWNAAGFPANTVSIARALVLTGAVKDPSSWAAPGLPILLQPGTALVVNTETNNAAFRRWATGLTFRFGVSGA